MSHPLLFFAAAASLVLVGAVRADDDLKSPAGPDAQQIETIIEQLDAPQFADRQEASRKLNDLGDAALPHLERIASRGSREASGRALDLLKRSLRNGNADQSRTANDVLQRLTQSNRSSVAQQARDVLFPSKRSGGGASFPPWPIANRAIGAPVPVGGATRTVLTLQVNGRREVEIRENDQTVKLQTLPDGRIAVDLTETRNGRPVTRQVTAKDVNELKQKDADLGKLYEQYQAGPLRIGPPIFGGLRQAEAGRAAPALPAR